MSRTVLTPDDFLGLECCDPERRHDFIFLFDVTNSNPNGDPDAGNLPRTDPQTRKGIVTDVCLKRKIRNYVQRVKSGAEGYHIYINEEGIPLNVLHKEAHRAIANSAEKDPASDNAQTETGEGEKKANADGKPSAKEKLEKINQAREYMWRKYYDVRMFGAVMSTGEQEDSCGRVWGPMQLSFAMSVDPVFIHNTRINRIVRTKEDEKEGYSQFGRKPVVRYGLYKAKGFYTPRPVQWSAGGNGRRVLQVTSEDMALFWSAITNMFSLDASASRPEVYFRGLYIFSHSSPLGDAPAYALFDCLRINYKPDITTPGRFEDYVIGVSYQEIPERVRLTEVYPWHSGQDELIRLYPSS